MEKKSIRNRYIIKIFTILICILFISSTASCWIDPSLFIQDIEPRNHSIFQNKESSFVSYYETIEKLPKTKLQKMPFIQTKVVHRDNDLDFSVFGNDGNYQNPCIVYDEKESILAFAEGPDAQIYGRWASIVDDRVEWNDYIIAMGCFFDESRPKIDYYGAGSSAWGTCTAGSSCTGFVYYLNLPDITDPSAGSGWAYFGNDFSVNGYSHFDSADVACYANTSNSPSSSFFGIIALTGDTTTKDNTIMFSYVDSQNVFLFPLTNISVDCSNISTEIDQTTGRIYVVCDYTNSDQFEEGSLVLYHDISQDAQWYSGDWSGYFFEGLHHPTVSAENGKVCIVGEKIQAGAQEDIVCYYSIDNGETFLESKVTATENFNELFPIVILGFIPIPIGSIPTFDYKFPVCMYIKEGNLYLSYSLNDGAFWENVPIRINDVPGVVLGQYGGFSIDGYYPIWTDTRNDHNEVFSECFSHPGYSWPEIQIHSGFGLNITANIAMPYSSAAYFVNWKINITGGILFTKREITGLVEEIPLGSIQTISSGRIFGLGRITITVEAEPWFGEPTSTTADGFVFGLFVYIF